METDTFEFSADINELMKLIIDSFYSNKDVFLRELISNASDSLDKIKYESLTDISKLELEKNLKIEIVTNKIDNTITIQDTGIGMTRSDMINNLGTIAKSGTKAFLKASKDDLSMIGCFGVGFYSAYLVAKNVKVYSKNNDDQQYCWESSAGKIFTISLDNITDRILRGTRIVLYLKEDSLEFLEEQNIRNLIKKYSSFIEYPISLLVNKTKTDYVNCDETEIDSNDTVIQLDKDNKVKKVVLNYDEFEVLNVEKPLWLRNKESIKEDEYDYFFKNCLVDGMKWEDYLHVDHSKCEGQLEFNSLLYIPEKMLMGMYANNRLRKSNVKLYVRKVFITDNCEQIIPEYLCFMLGVINIDGLNLNISRETMQENKDLKIVKKVITKKCINMMNELSLDNNKYKIFYREFSKYIKLGIGNEDDINTSKLYKLLRYYSTKSEYELTTIEQYISRMKDGQESIYYITGESLESVRNTPFLEKIKNKSYEVLYMVDPVDEYVLLKLTEYEGKKLVSVTKGDLDIDDLITENDRLNCKELIKIIAETLGDNIMKVEITNRLTDSPSCLISDINGYSANLERIIKTESFKLNSKLSKSTRIFEINPNHQIIKILCNRVKNNRNCSSIKETIWILYELSIITSGLTLNSTLDFNKRILGLVEKDLNNI